MLLELMLLELRLELALLELRLELALLELRLELLELLELRDELTLLELRDELTLLELRLLLELTLRVFEELLLALRELAVALWIILTVAPAIAGKFVADTDLITKPIFSHSPLD